MERLPGEGNVDGTCLAFGIKKMKHGQVGLGCEGYIDVKTVAWYTNRLAL